MKEDKILLAGIEDKWQQCSDYYTVTSTGFLDLRQRSLAEGLCRTLRKRDDSIRSVFFGGYPDAERTVLLFLPDYVSTEGWAEQMEPSAFASGGWSDTDGESVQENSTLDGMDSIPLAGIRLHKKSGGRALRHGDYLGSLTGLGLSRDVIGDILVRETGADLIVLEEIRDFILTHYDKAGRTELKPEAIPLSALQIPKGRMKEYQDTVASLRLDNMVASAFSMSRSMAVEAIKGGMVFVNHSQADKVSMTVKEGDQLVCRGKGKVLFAHVDGKTRKDRFLVTMKKYL